MSNVEIFANAAALLIALAYAMQSGTMRAFKVGGIRFLRLGRIQFSFCVCRRKAS